MNERQPPLEGTRAATIDRTRQTRDDQGKMVEYTSNEVVQDNEKVEAPESIEWLRLAKEANNNATDWLTADMYFQWQRNNANYRSIHPAGSKYHSNAYKYRSKMFRPKTRTAVRKVEAGVVAALFSNQDVLNITAQDQSNPEQRASAEIAKALIQERVTDGSIPWYHIAVGGAQDTANYGLVISHQYWEYEKDGDGAVLKDRPVAELCPPENIRLDRAAKWTDPINDSPYFIQLLPMYIGDVLDKMKKIDDKTGQPEWKSLTKGQLRSANKADYDGVRAARYTPNADPKGSHRTQPDTDFDTVWIHRNFIRKNGVDQMYYTAGTEFMLSEPLPTHKAYPHLKRGERPYAAGSLALESHKVYPDAYVQLGQNLQSMANDVANRRHDNVLLAMDKRFLIRREANIDRDQLFRTVPGGGIETDDPQTDVKVIETNDVTGSAYAEQDRINADFDDLMGQFNQGTKQQGAKGDSVGGMSLMMSDTDTQTDYIIRTLLTTWVKPLMSQLIRLEQYYETDMMMIAVAAQKADVWVKFGVNKITDELLRHSLTVNVNVGIGATSPERKLNMLMSGTQALTQIPGVAEKLNPEEFIKEVYGAIGYQDGSRFLLPEEGPSPKEQELMQQLQELQKIIDTDQVKSQGRIDMERVRQKGQIEEARVAGEYKLSIEDKKQRIEDLKILIAAEGNDIKRAEIELESDALVFQVKSEELGIKRETEQEARDMQRTELERGDTGKDTPTPARPSPRVASSGAGVMMRDRYGDVPYAEG